MFGRRTYDSWSGFWAIGAEESDKRTLPAGPPDRRTAGPPAGGGLYGVLSAKGVPARIVIFPKENHWVLKPQAAELWWKEVFAWLEKYVGKGATE